MKYYKYKTSEWHYVVVLKEEENFLYWTDEQKWKWSVYSWEHIFGLIGKISSFDYGLEEIGRLEILVVCGSWHHMLRKKTHNDRPSQHH